MEFTQGQHRAHVYLFYEWMYIVHGGITIGDLLITTVYTSLLYIHMLQCGSYCDQKGHLLLLCLC